MNRSLAKKLWQLRLPTSYGSAIRDFARRNGRSSKVFRRCVINFDYIACWPLSRTADSNSTNAVNFSSACTTKRLPSSRCASAIQIVRPSRSKAETQPRLQPALLRRNSAFFCCEAVSTFVGMPYICRNILRFPARANRRICESSVCVNALV